MIRLARISKDGRPSFELFKRGSVPKYTILSHTWEDDGQELTYHDILAGGHEGKKGSRKVEFCKKRTMDLGLEYFWMDSICIDRSSSAELSEAVNSMFTCAGPPIGPVDAFYGCRWLKRGWTLQELIAPQQMTFSSEEGTVLGTRLALAPIIHEVTNIPIESLINWTRNRREDEEILSWSRGRETTLEEDQAYCMLGLLGVPMPIVYGEGKEHAWRRLHEEVDRRRKRAARGTVL